MRVPWFLCLSLVALACTPPARENDDADTVGPSCTDRQRDGTETDVDCGGGCPGCANGRACAAVGDCASGICSAGSCRKAAGCAGESDEELCARAGKTCGTVAATDRCGDARQVGCGSCPRDVTCTGASSSGLPSGLVVGTLSETQTATLCDFLACAWGGYGKKVSCGEGSSVSGPSGLDECASGVRQCPNLTVGDVEPCQGKIAKSPCDALSIVMSDPACTKVRDCMQQG